MKQRLPHQLFVLTGNRLSSRDVFVVIDYKFTILFLSNLIEISYVKRGLN